MPIPDFQSIMLPLLKYTTDKKEHSLREAIDYISSLFSLTDEERREMLPSGYDFIINNRVAWARTYLKKAGLIEDPRRGIFKITEKGTGVLKENPPIINISFLKRYPEFLEFQSPKTLEKSEEALINVVQEKGESPEELIEFYFKKIKDDLVKEILEKIRKSSPSFFERITGDVLRAMGYGDVKITGGPGDGGIDGIVYQDKLGLEKIYLQAKRYQEGNLVTPNIIKHFIGTLDTLGASKGIMITTSDYHKDAILIANNTSKNLILLNGIKFTELMIDYDIGVSKKVYEIKKIDSDYFEE